MPIPMPKSAPVKQQRYHVAIDHLYDELLRRCADRTIASTFLVAAPPAMRSPDGGLIQWAARVAAHRDVVERLHVIRVERISFEDLGTLVQSAPGAKDLVSILVTIRFRPQVSA